MSPGSVGTGTVLYVDPKAVLHSSLSSAGSNPGLDFERVRLTGGSHRHAISPVSLSDSQALYQPERSTVGMIPICPIEVFSPAEASKDRALRSLRAFNAAREPEAATA